MLARPLLVGLTVALCLAPSLATADGLQPSPRGAAQSPAQQVRDVESTAKAVSQGVARVAQRLETGLVRDDVKVASDLYRLEMASTAVIYRAQNADFPTDVVKVSVVADALSVHASILSLQERVLDHTIAELDRALPGEPGRELWARQGIDLYRPLFREGTPDPNAPPPTRAANQAVFSRMKSEFVTDGGSFAKINELGPRSLSQIQSGELVEWVQVGYRIRVTAAGAKHPVIAGGKSVRGAGSMRVYKDPEGKILFAVVSNSSGNYKPGTGSVAGLTAKLTSLGVPRRQILETRILPGEPVLVKLLLKSKKTYSKDKIKAIVAKLQTSAEKPLRSAMKLASAPAPVRFSATTVRSIKAKVRNASKIRRPAPRARPAPKARAPRAR